VGDPSPNGDNGDRDAAGRFAKGNAGGPGNPFARATARLRAELVASVEPADIREVVGVLIGKAKAGDMAAVRELLDRAIGKPVVRFADDPDGPCAVQVIIEPMPWERGQGGGPEDGG